MVGGPPGGRGGDEGGVGGKGGGEGGGGDGGGGDGEHPATRGDGWHGSVAFPVQMHILTSEPCSACRKLWKYDSHCVGVSEGMSALRRMQVVPAEMERVSVRPTRSVHVLQSVRSTEPRLHAPPTQWQMPKNSASPLTK